MKKNYFLLFLFFFFVSFLSAQNTESTQNSYLPTSSTTSDYALIYKIKDSKKLFQTTEVLELLKQNKTASNSFMTLVDSVKIPFGYYRSDFPKNLDYGYYLTVWANEGVLKTELETVAPLNIVLQSNAKKAWLIVYDSLGHELPNLEIKFNTKLLSYDQKLKKYDLPKRKETANVEINYAGQTWYLFANKKSFNDNYKPSILKKMVYRFPIKYFWIVPYNETKKVVKKIQYGDPEDLGIIRFFVRIFTKNEEENTGRIRFDGQHKYGNGYFVTDKLKYRPLDTLRFKTYLVNKKGKPISNNEIDIFITKDGKDYIKLHSIETYRKGGFESQFVLTDSLKLKLDNFVGIVLKDKDGKVIIAQGIDYQDYSLPTIKSFAIKTTETKHYKNTPFALRLTAKDFNNLTVLDGKVEIEIDINSIQTTYKPSINTTYSTWKHKQKLESFGETIIYIPDSIFPAADLTYKIKAVLLNSNNERREKTLSINYHHFTKKPSLEARIEDGFVYAIYKEGKDTIPKQGFLQRRVDGFSGSQAAKIDTITFPFKEKINAVYKHFEFWANTDEYEKNSSVKNKISTSADVEIEGYFLHDSLIITLQNPLKSVIRYSLFCKNNLIKKEADSSSFIRIAVKDKYKKVYVLQTSYTFAGDVNERQRAFLRNREQLFVSLDAPLLTSPSFKEKINVTVTDYKKRPVKNADLTVLATNSQFEDYAKIQFPSSQKSRFRFKKKKKISEIYFKNKGSQNENLVYNSYWKNRLGLDSVAYYNFIYPQKNGFRFSIPYQNIKDTLKSKLENVNVTKEKIKEITEKFEKNHNPNTGALFPFLFYKSKYENIEWIKIDDSLAYFVHAKTNKDHLIELSKGIHKLEIRLMYQTIFIDSISVEMGKETILSFDLENLPTYIHTKKASHYLSKKEKMMLGSHTFLGITYGVSNLNTSLKIQQGNSEIITLYPEFKKDKETQNYYYEWEYPLLHKGEFKILREHSEKWDTLYFEPFVVCSFDKGKYYKNDSTFDEISYHKEGAIIQGDTLSKKSFISFQSIHGLNKIEGLLKINPLFPFINYSKYRTYKFKPTLYTWATPQIEIVSKDWSKLTFTNIDSLSKNFEKQYFFRNRIPFKGKLPAGMYQVLVFYSKEGGSKCQKITSVKINEDNANLPPTFIDFEKQGIHCYERERVQVPKNEKIEIPQKVESYTNEELQNGRLYRGRVIDEDGLPLIGATILIKGTERGTTADFEGDYEIIAPIGSTLVFNYVGFKSIEKTTTRYDIWLDATLMGQELSEVVVVSNSDASYTSAVGSANIDSFLSGRVAGVQLSQSSMPLSNSSKLELKNSDLKDDFVQNKKKKIRNYFTDNAIWQPTLRTDKKGKASFEITYPDDITSWKTLAIAYGKKNKNGQALSQTNSFLTLSGQLSLPRFLIEGDSVRIIGKIASYSSDSIKVNSHFDINGKNIPQKKRTILFSSVDSLRFSVADNSEKTPDLSIDSLNNLQDSLTIQYVMNADISEKQIYTDGEERKIPILKKGIIQNRGFFAVLEGDTTLNLRAFKDSISNQNSIKLFVKDNILEAMISELEHIQNYAYACNEQKASKIRAYILEKEIKTTLNLSFEKKKQDELNNLIKKLVEAQYDDGWWGWWANSAPNINMTAYIYGVLFDARKKGYSIPNETLSKAERVLRDMLPLLDANGKTNIYTVLAKNKDYQQGYKNNVSKLATALQIHQDTTKYHLFYNQLSILRLRQLYDLPISLQILQKQQQKSSLGGIFWQEEDYSNYYSLFRNNTQLNLLAYQLLRDAKNKNTHSIDLAKVRQYFLETRNQNGYWKSTHESASILSIILPDFQSKTKNKMKAELRVNNELINTEKTYIYSKENLPNEITKKGLAPVFVSLSQEYFEAQIAQKTTNNFQIKTYFKDKKTNQNLKTNSDSLYITAGKPIVLKVEVVVKKEAEYVSIEVPIPASCVYGKNPYSLQKNYYRYHKGIETYREEFKHKTAIFCTKIPIGKHTFEIILEPRYSGVFTLNPASVELMYFPSISGNEETKKVFVE